MSKTTATLAISLLVGFSTSATTAQSVELQTPRMHCARAVEDRATGDCLWASTVPELGLLYPLSSALFVSSEGFVGIGTTVPTAQLHLNGPMRIENNMPITGNSANGIGYLNIARVGTGNELRIGHGNMARIEFTTGGTNGGRSVILKNGGELHTTNPDGTTRIRMGVTQQGAAYMQLENTANGERNVLLDHLLDYPDNGIVGVLSPNDPDRLEAGMYVDTAGRGILFADIKNFRTRHPDRPDTEIWYASLEGPEAACYVRGTASLTQGQAVVSLPEHFRAVAGESEMTVLVTPRSADSTGLAVTQRSLDRFTVRELHRGGGSYDFDWEVRAVRRGYENYLVIRPIEHLTPATAVIAESRP